MTGYFDSLETRSADDRAADLARALPAQIARAQALPGYAGAAGRGRSGRGPRRRGSGGAAGAAQVRAGRGAAPAAALRRLHPRRRGGAGAGVPVAGPDLRTGPDHAPTGGGWGGSCTPPASGRGDIVQNCFSYHLTPAGMIFESGARAVGATVLPAGTGQTELQARAAHDLGVTAYAGHPGLPEGHPRQGRRDGPDAGDHQGGGRRRRAVPGAAPGLCRPRHRLPAMLCHRRPGQHRLRKPGDGRA